MVTGTDIFGTGYWQESMWYHGHFISRTWNKEIINFFVPVSPCTFP